MLRPAPPRGFTTNFVYCFCANPVTEKARVNICLSRPLTSGLCLMSAPWKQSQTLPSALWEGTRRRFGARHDLFCLLQRQATCSPVWSMVHKVIEGQGLLDLWLGWTTRTAWCLSKHLLLMPWIWWRGRTCTVKDAWYPRDQSELHV